MVTFGRRLSGHEPVAELVALPAAILIMEAFRSGLPWAPTGEPPRYFEAAGRLLAGEIPYAEVPSEYPPLAFAAWLLPRLLSGDVHGYAWLLAIQNMVLATGIGVCLVWLSRRWWSSGPTSLVLTLAALIVVGVAGIVVWLFDLLPAMLTALGLVAFVRGMPGTAGAVLGLGALAKVYPVVLLPVLVLGALGRNDRAGAVRMLSAFVLVVVLVMVPLIAVAGDRALSFLDYQDARGLQLESGLAGLAMLAGTWQGASIWVEQAFGAWQVEGAIARDLAALQPLLLVGLLGVVMGTCLLRLRQEYRGAGDVEPATIVAYATAAVIATMVASKVLSPQFLVWLLPLAPLLPRPQALLAVLASLLTMLLLGSNYVGLMTLRPEHVLALNLRNLVLVVLMVWLVFDRRPGLASVSRVRTPA
jgi:hypothetical protein